MPLGLRLNEGLGGVTLAASLTIQRTSSEAMTLRRVIVDLVVATFVAYEGVLRYLQIQWRVDAAHCDGRPFVPLDRRIPEQR